MAACVAGDLDNGQGRAHFGQCHFITLCDHPRNAGNAVVPRSEYWQVCRQLGQAANMVGVMVGYQYGGQGQCFTGKVIADWRRIAGIDYNGVLSLA